MARCQVFFDGRSLGGIVSYPDPNVDVHVSIISVQLDAILYIMHVY